MDTGGCEGLKGWLSELGRAHPVLLCRPGPDGGGGGQDAVMINLLIRGSVLLSLFLTHTHTHRQTVRSGGFKLGPNQLSLDHQTPSMHCCHVPDIMGRQEKCHLHLVIDVCEHVDGYRFSHVGVTEYLTDVWRSDLNLISSGFTAVWSSVEENGCLIFSNCHLTFKTCGLFGGF